MFDVRPNPSWYVPDAHEEQTPDPSFAAYVPGLQLVQMAMPFASLFVFDEYFPVAHLVQVEVPATAYDPAEHPVQDVGFSTELPKYPAEHI